MRNTLVIGFTQKGVEFCCARFPRHAFTSEAADLVNYIARCYTRYLADGCGDEKYAVLGTLLHIGASFGLDEQKEDLLEISDKLCFRQESIEDFGWICMNYVTREKAWQKADMKVWLEADKKRLVLTEASICSKFHISGLAGSVYLLNDTSSCLRLDPSDIARLSDIHDEYLSYRTEAPFLEKECSEMVYAVEHEKDALTPDGTVLVQDGSLVNLVEGQVTNTSTERVFALDNGVIYVPIN
jgi:hypothetical protein